MVSFLICGSVILTLFILYIVYYVYALLRNNIFQRMGMPGPTPVPFIGEIINVFRKGLYKSDMELVRKYGKIVGVYQMNKPVIVLSDPELVQKVLIKDFHVFMNRRTISGILGPLAHGLIQLKDENWKNARAIVSPTFSAAKLKAMYGLMNEVSKMFNQRLQDYADRQEMLNIKEVTQQLALDTIGSTLFGMETNSLQNENTTLINHLKKLFTVSLTSFMVIIRLVSPRFAFYLGKKGYSILPGKTVNYLTELINQILSRRRQHLEQRNDFIQIMVDHEESVKQELNVDKESENSSTQDSQWGTLKKTLNDKEILGQALIFLLAGYETVSTLLPFFFYIMATDSVIQEKVYQEIIQIIEDDEITPDNINQLPYLDMVINETLRMYPPVIRFDRVVSDDYQLGEYHISKEMVVMVPVYGLHHDPTVWPNPEKFIPERFSAKEKAKRHPMTFLPFGDGPRNCIGMRFALLEAKITIVRTLRTFEIQTCEKTAIPLKLNKTRSLLPKDGIWLRVIRRSS